MDLFVIGSASEEPIPYPQKKQARQKSDAFGVPVKKRPTERLVGVIPLCAAGFYLWGIEIFSVVMVFPSTVRMAKVIS